MDINNVVKQLDYVHVIVLKRTLFKHWCASSTDFRFNIGSPIPMNTTFVTLCLKTSSIANTYVEKCIYNHFMMLNKL